MVEPVSVEAVMAELVVSVDTVKAFAPRLLTVIELTETALVHVSALLAPLVKTMPVGTAVKRDMILLHDILREDVERSAEIHRSSWGPLYFT
jgi:hypothetical protein